VPSHAWIDQRGYVKYFTSGENASIANVEKVLGGADVDLLFKKEYRDFDMYASLLREGNGRQLKHIKYYSLISEKIDDDGGGGIVPVHADTAMAVQSWIRKYVNVPILTLYKAA